MIRRSGNPARGPLAAAMLLGSALMPVAIAQAQPAAPQAAPPTCPASGYSPPYYGVFGDNDGTTRAYEMASPCSPKVVRDAAEAIGMGRYAPLGLKNVTTIRFSAEGTFADPGKAPAPATVDVGISYVLPAMRMVLDRSGQKSGEKSGQTQIRVFAEDKAWDERSPGVGAVASGGLADRSVLVKLTPFGALWSIVEAEGHVKVAKGSDGATTLTGASPYDGIPVTVTLDAKNLPIKVSFDANGKHYSADFAEYTDSWESPYLVIFPKHLNWFVNGKPLASFTVTKFHSNPYVIFPELDEFKKTASR